MSKGKAKKSWKEKLRERQLNYHRKLEAHRVRIERKIIEQRAKIRKKRWIILSLFLLAIMPVIVYSAGQYLKSSTSHTEQGIGQTQGESVPHPQYIYIWPDGRVEPSNAPLSVINSSYYKLTGNVSFPIIVLKDDVIIDGAGYYVVGAQIYGSRGVDLSCRKNITIVNIKIMNFDYALYMDQTLNSKIFASELTNNYCAIWISRSSFINVSSNKIYENRGYALWMKNSTNNVISWNLITRHSNYTIYLGHSSNNTIKFNTIENNRLGIFLFSSTWNIITYNNISKNYQAVHFLYSSENQIIANDIVENGVGVGFSESCDNKIHHNNFINNIACVTVENSINIFDNGVSEGNYWSDYLNNNPNAEKLNGIWNMPYVIDEKNRDNYPLTAPIKIKLT